MHTTHIVCGSPGAGKSTYARKLASARQAVLLDIDTVTERLVRLALREAGHDPDDRDSEYFKQTYREPVYETLFDIARENLPFQDAVLVGPFTRELRDLGWPSKLSKRLGGPVEVIEVLELASQGNPNKAIAKKLFITEAIVKSHFVHIFSKLGVADRTAAVTKAVKEKIIKI